MVVSDDNQYQLYASAYTECFLSDDWLNCILPFAFDSQSRWKLLLYCHDIDLWFAAFYSASVSDIDLGMSNTGTGCCLIPNKIPASS